MTPTTFCATRLLAGRPLALACFTRLAAGLALAMGALAAQAVPVSVAINGLPPGLSPVVAVKRNTCPDGMGWKHNASQALTETSTTVFDRITLPSGQTTIRSRVVTRYVASFDTPATLVSSPGDLTERRCSSTGMAPDLFRFELQVPGFAETGRATTLNAFLGETPQAAPVTLNSTQAARTTSLTVPAGGTLARGMTHTLDARFDTTLGTVQAQRLLVQRPSALIPGLFSTTATLFVRASDGAACVQAGASTRCLGDGSFPEAGGVILRGIQRGGAGLQPGTVRFQFELAQGFATGAARLTATAEASDLPAYRVDDTPQPLDLLPWQASIQTVTVQ